MASSHIPRSGGRPISGSPLAVKLVMFLALLLAVPLVTQQLVAAWRSRFLFTPALSSLVPPAKAHSGSVDVGWYPPSQTAINNLADAVNGTGVYGFIFNSSKSPDGEYGVYNWGNMPHVRRTEYITPPSNYELVYVELIHRHHKRTPYSSNSFPVEPYPWNCDDAQLHFSGQPSDNSSSSHAAAPAHWKGHISPVNPFVPSGWTGTCLFPQITASGLDDSWQHGQDLYGAYHDLLGFLPDRGSPGWQAKTTYRVTQNVITSQVAGMVISGMWGNTAASVPLSVQAAGVDSLEPTYPCSAGSSLFSAIQSPSSNAAWGRHLALAAPLYAALDAISGVPPSDAGFHASLDHYYDNLSARQCHGKPLPCEVAIGGAGGAGGVNGTNCVTQRLANEVYRLGNWEYSHTFRDDPASLAACAATFGVWIAELAAHLRAAAEGDSRTLWYHNIAHDGSVSRLLGVLQVDVMVWPGMGSEVVFELWRDKESNVGGDGGSSSGDGTSKRTSAAKATGSLSGYYVRVLWGGRVMNSSSPALGRMDMLPVETLLAYFDGLVGVNASLVTGKCNGSIPP